MEEGVEEGIGGTVDEDGVKETAMSDTDSEEVVIESSVAFGVYGVGIDLEAITHHLGISPTCIHRIGDPDMLGEPFPHDAWLVESPFSRSEPLDVHLKWLAGQLIPHREYIQSLKASAKLRIYCNHIDENDQCGFSVSPEALTVFTVLDLPMEISVLFIGRE